MEVLFGFSVRIALRIILIRGPRLQITVADGSLETDFHESRWTVRGVAWSPTSSVRHWSTTPWTVTASHKGECPRRGGQSNPVLRAASSALVLSCIQCCTILHNSKTWFRKVARHTSIAAVIQRHLVIECNKCFLQQYILVSVSTFSMWKVREMFYEKKVLTSS